MSGPSQYDPIAITEGGNKLPSNFSKLEKLVPLVGTIVTIMSDPKEWVKTVIAEWVVGGILDAAEIALGWVIFGYEAVRDAILTAIPPLTAPFRILENAVTGVIETVFGAALGVAHMAGLAGPPAAAFAIALLATVLAVVVFALLRVIPGSDALEGGLEALR